MATTLDALNNAIGEARGIRDAATTALVAVWDSPEHLDDTAAMKRASIANDKLHAATRAWVREWKRLGSPLDPDSSN